MKKCPSCEVKRGLGQWGFHWGIVPKSGPAAEKGICAKCYREKYGPLSAIQWISVKKISRAVARAWKKMRSIGADK